MSIDMSDGGRRSPATVPLRHIVWPDTASRFAQVTTAAEAVLALAGLIAAVLGFFGWLPVSSERAAQFLLALGSLVTLAFVTEAAERRALMKGFEGTQEALAQLLRQSPVREVPPGEIGPEIDRLLEGSREWLFRGGSARYLRGFTLPRLSARRTLDTRVLIALLDPRDLHLCEAYAQYRSKIGRTDPEVSARSIQAEILATIYLAGWYATRRRLQPRIVLLRSFSQLRYDVGSDGLLVTVADRTRPALYASADSWYYRSLRDELEQMFHGNPEVELPTTLELFPSAISDASVEQVRRALAGTVVKHASLLTGAADANDVQWDSVREAVVNPREPNT
jgi:hypothetical protein